MKGSNKSKFSSEAQSYINSMILKLEKDLSKHIDKTIEKKSKTLRNELWKMASNISEKAHQKNVKQFLNSPNMFQNSNSVHSQSDNGFNLSGSQMLNSIANNIKKSIFS